MIRKASIVLFISVIVSGCVTNNGASSGTNIQVKGPGYQAVVKAARKHNVDVRLALAVAKAESGGNCKARSSKNAKGVMQVIPSTGRKHGVRKSNALYNCNIGAEVGIKELKYCLRLAGGNRPKALTCYNAGPGWLTSRRYKGRNIPSETRKYIKNITGKNVRKVT